MPPPISRLVPAVGVSPEALRAAQLELNPSVAYELAAKSAAENWWRDAPSGLELYHGTPHVFASNELAPYGQFDFLNNIGKGEGAQSFGPGSYLTGDRGLAAYYAQKLTLPGRRMKGPPDSWQAGASQDYEGFLEFLRARAISKAIGNTSAPQSWVASYYGSPGSRTSGLRASIDAGQDSYTFKKALEQYGASPTGNRWDKPFTGYALLDTTVRHPGLGAYDDALKRWVSSPQAMDLGTALRSPDAGKRAADAGRALYDLLPSDMPDPAIVMRSKRVGFVPNDGGKYRNYGNVPDEYTGSKGGEREGALSLLRRQLGAVEDAHLAMQHGNVSSPRTYKQSMDQSIDLVDMGRNYVPYDERPKPQPNIYTAQVPMGPQHLFSYDFPARSASPEVLGALSQLYARHLAQHMGPDEAVRAVADLRGQALIDSLRSKLGSKNTVLALRDAGIPGMFFRRAGERDFSKTDPKSFAPDAHNFVWFDDPALQIIKRENKAAGGAV